MFKTALFLIVIIILITKFNSYYRDIYDRVFEISGKNIQFFVINNTFFLYIYVTALFFLASKGSLFELTNGYYGSYIKKMLSSVNSDKAEYNKPNPFIDDLSIVAIILFSLLTTISGSSLGSEAVMIYLSVALMNYLYFKFKKLLGLHDINTELLIYTGYAIGFGATFTSLISNVIFILEKMVINHSGILYTPNVIILLFIVLFIHSLFKSRIPIFNIKKIHFDYYNTTDILYIVILSLIIGVVCFLFFTSFITLYNSLKHFKYKDFVVVVFGALLAFMIKTYGMFVSGNNEVIINEGFKNAGFKNGTNDVNSENFNYKNILGKLINCIISLGSGLSGGIILPAMTIGAGLGSVYSNLLSHKYFNSIQTIVPMTMPIENIMYVGMVAFLSPMLDAPLTSAVVINQISNQSFNTIPISIVASFVSYYTYKKLHK